MVLAWINQIPSNRISAGHSLSEKCRIISGIPQGCVLGPILFVVYICYAVSCPGNNVNVKLFVDDVKLYSCIDVSSIDALQRCINIILRWAIVWQLKWSASKNNVLTLGSIHYNNSYTIKDILLLILVL